MHGKYLSVVLLPRLNGKIVYRTVEEFDASVSGRDQDLVFMDFGPR
jgi:hypothetical protein